MDTVTSLCNDYLLHIKADKVRMKTENEEELTIVSDRYNDFPDLEVIEMCGSRCFGADERRIQFGYKEGELAIQTVDNQEKQDAL